MVEPYCSTLSSSRYVLMTYVQLLCKFMSDRQFVIISTFYKKHSFTKNMVTENRQQALELDLNINTSG